MRTLLALLLVAASAVATERVSFALPDHNGRVQTVADFKSRYILLVYQGIP